MPRTLLVVADKTFRITIPDEAKVTFGPWSPPGDKSNNYEERQGGRVGTLRVYAGKTQTSSIIGVWSGVKSFRETSLEYEEKVNVETGSQVWKSDKKGFHMETDIQKNDIWEGENAPELTSGDDNGF